MQQQNDLFLEIQSKDFYFNAAIPIDYEVVLPNGTVVSLYSKPKAEVQKEDLRKQKKSDENQSKNYGDDSDAYICDVMVFSKEWLTLSKVAKLLKTSYRAIYRQYSIGKLEASWINNRLHVSRDEFERFREVYRYIRRSNPNSFEGSIKCVAKM